MSLIYAREHARAAKDFKTADQLRQQLQDIGITLFDKTNSWRAADGRTGRIPTFAEVESGAMPDLGPSTEPEGSDANIKSLVQQREQARASKDFARSDQLREELKGMGVELFDKEKLWRSNSGLSGIIIGYKGTPTDVEITTLVMQREKARSANDYATSDMIRDELKQFGISIEDKSKIWRSPDGRQGAVPSFLQLQGAPVGQPALVAAAPNIIGHHVAAVGMPDVTQQLMQAAMHAAQRPDTAARALALLQQHGLAPMPMAVVPAPPRQSVVTGMHNTIPGPPPVKKNSAAVVGGTRSAEAAEAAAFIEECSATGRTSLQAAEIDWLVGLRERVRQNKDFRTADELRDSMRSVLGLELHEKEKRWTCTDGQQGNIPLWNALV